MSRTFAVVPDEWDDEPTVVAPLPGAARDVAEPDDPTVMAPPLEVSGEIRAPRHRDPDELRRLFAEPPHLPTATGAPAARPRLSRRRRRRRAALLAFVLMAGTWLVIQPKPGAQRPVSRLRSVTAAAAPVQPEPIVHAPEPSEPATPGAAAAHVAAGRYEAALGHYRALAADNPDEPVYDVIVDVVRREVIAQCREQANPSCEWR